MEQRLQKLLAAAGVASRRSSEDLIAAGRVTVNGRKITEPGAKADPERDVIRVDGKPLQTPAEHVYIVLNKPTGYVSTVKDPHAEHTVMELVRGFSARIYPVGRLDADSAGLLLLTNDGAFTERLTHPSHQVPKTYRVVARGEVSAFAAADLRHGVILDDGMTAPAELEFVDYDPTNNATVLDITIHEGRNRQVRRMMEAVGYPVLALTRMRIGPIELKGLAPGTWRKLHPAEVQALLAEADSRPPQLPQVPTDQAEGIPAPQPRGRGAGERTSRRDGEIRRHGGVKARDAGATGPIGSEGPGGRPAGRAASPDHPTTWSPKTGSPAVAPEIMEAARELSAKLGRDRGPEPEEAAERKREIPQTRVKSARASKQSKKPHGR